MSDERILGFREEDWTARDIRVDKMDKGKMIGNTFVFCEECLGGREVGMMMGETGVFREGGAFREEYLKKKMGPSALTSIWSSGYTERKEHLAESPESIIASLHGYAEDSASSPGFATSKESCEEACWEARGCFGMDPILATDCVHECEALCDDLSEKVSGSSSGGSEKDISSPEYPFMDLGDLPPGLDSKPDYSAEEYRSPFDDRELYDGEDDVLL